jgi:hypothetical protein
MSNSGKLKKYLQELEKESDNLGKKIEPKIIKTVAVLNALGFPTTAFCQGHNASRQAVCWIDIGKEIPKKLWRKVKGNDVLNEIPEVKNLRKENLRLQKRLIKLLSKFYQKRRVPFDVQLTIQPRGVYGKFRLTNVGADIQEILPPAERKKKLKRCQKEMQEFTRFLCKKHFQF